ncbi:MAG: HlyD family type I secretion periplasmic adaptor subunit, partial [Burkholderiaceae bacterium]|nr:HlyD family type I secretion periplasmic adaptor subunit [Burkholderiaceae bacterium]
MSQKAEEPNDHEIREKGRIFADRLKNWILPPVDRNAPPVSEDLKYMPTRLAAFFLSPPRASFLIVRYTVILFLLALLWASFCQIDEMTHGEGKVIPSSHVQVIQNLEGGIVSDIPVKIGQIVRKNQIVIKLDEKRFA